ncbi:transposase [Streptomyces griseorubiginosus]|uniref:transposase n=1 Tax=Streptomyces griseorubiginosus TaxID=67304 RepID=UPI003AF35924
MSVRGWRVTEPIARSVPRSISIHTGVALTSAVGKSMLVKPRAPVSVHAVSDAASCPLNWRLFLPREWADDAVRRPADRRAGRRRAPGEMATGTGRPG